LARWEGIGLVRLGLQSLDDRSRELVQMKFQENLSYKEISERTGLKSGYVGYLLHHALKSLAGELSKAGLLP
jgi:RNA polymerase sigma-70 factor (ECF subfamily)